ncbi:hypothetical protein GCM10009730_49440 [Streptomyces albidochromogenes]
MLSPVRCAGGRPAAAEDVIWIIGIGTGPGGCPAPDVLMGVFRPLDRCGARTASVHRATPDGGDAGALRPFSPG